MKYLVSLTIIALLFASCNKENVAEENSADLNYQTASNDLNYKGIFATLDSKYRATVEITFPVSTKTIQGAKPKATLIFQNGKTIEAFADFNYAAMETIDNVIFSGNNLSFKFSSSENGANAIISDALFNNVATSIKVSQVRLGDPVPATYTGTYSCNDCGDHPVLGSGATQTFNVMISNGGFGATTDVTTQIILGTNDFGTTTGNEQLACASTGATTTACDINGISFNNLIAWDGVHTSDFTQGCDGVIGEWTYDSPNHGLLTGIFESDNACTSVLLDLNFNAFDGLGFSPTPSAGQLNSTNLAITGFSDGDLAFGGTITTGDYARGNSTGGVTTGGIYAGLVNTGDKCLLFQPGGSDFTPGVVNLRTQNTAGFTVSTVQIKADVLFRNDQGRSTIVSIEYSTDDITYTPIPGVSSVSSPLAATGGTLDLMTSFDRMIPISLDNNAFLYFRISSDDNGGSGSRDEVGVDNISILGY